jgi:hypothetical protein
MATLGTAFRELGECCAVGAIVVTTAGCGSSPNDGPGLTYANVGDGSAAPSGDTNEGGAGLAPKEEDSSSGAPLGVSTEDAAVDAPASSALDPGAISDSGADAAATDAGGSGSGPCAGGTVGIASSAMGAMGTPVNGTGNVEFNISTKTQIVGLHTTLTVPEKPPPSGTLFLWPGLQPLPGGKSYNPIGNGVLQPVLTWGGTCAPTAPNSYDNWWISAQYVNTYTSDQGYSGCHGGQGMDVAVGDQLDIAMTLAGTVWNQVVVDRQSGHMATFDMDMMGQAQDWAIFTIESDGSEPISDVVFTSTTLTLADANATACQPSTRGQNDYFSAPVSSPDGKTCCISKIILRAPGVAATTANTP